MRKLATHFSSIDTFGKVARDASYGPNVLARAGPLLGANLSRRARAQDSTHTSRRVDSASTFRRQVAWLWLFSSPSPCIQSLRDETKSLAVYVLVTSSVLDICWITRPSGALEPRQSVRVREELSVRSVPPSGRTQKGVQRPRRTKRP